MPLHALPPRPNRVIPVYTWESAEEQGRSFGKNRAWYERKFGRLATSFYQLPAKSCGREGILASHAIMTVLNGIFYNHATQPRTHNFMKPIVQHILIGDTKPRAIGLSRIMFRGLDRVILDEQLPGVIGKANLALSDLDSDLRLEMPVQPTIGPIPAMG
jgi:hypothetical protein